MISIEHGYPAYAEKCQMLREGESAYSGDAMIPYDMHYYRDGWYAFWKNPPNGHIGRRLRNRMELTGFLQGNPRAGFPILARNLSRYLTN